MKYRIFISSVQSEFASERKNLKRYLLSDPLLGEYVESVFIFEDHPAAKKRPGEIYLPKLADTDIYIGLFGAQYGNRVPEGEMSPTEREYDVATAHGLTKWIYVFDDETLVDPRMARLRKKAAGDHTYRHVKDRSMINQEFDKHESMPFNPLIAAAFYQARYIEHVGSGIEDVEVACAEAGLPQTTVDVRNRTIVHTIWRKTTKETGKTCKKTTKENEATTKETVGTTKEISLTTKEIPLSLRVHLEGFSDVARAIFKFFWDHREHSAESAAKEFGLTPDGVRYHIKKLKQGNLLHHEGPTKKGRWVFGSKPKGKRGAK